jgi:glyoxylase-like metal-dependent hydrolase (beta-lactamase superfamily II)
VANVLHDAFLPTNHVRLTFNILLVKFGSEWVMIDSGCGTLFGPAGGRLLANLRAAGIAPELVSAIILTHVHGDHFGGLLDASTKEPLFKNAALFIHKNEYAFWTSASPDLSAMPMDEATKKDFIQGAQNCLAALKPKWQLITGGEKLFDGLEIIDAPGHTAGHITLMISSGTEQVLHIVDTAHHHAISFAHPEWTMAFDAQPELAIATRKKLFDRAAADRLRIFGAHMPFPALGHVRRAGDAFEYIIEPMTLS